ncbi:hypothetical protein M404DRAFT_710499 [Pisolithus tinctorius Marx 270]|uniref:Uncharacterized protein n=1 Tax=Pisolithus tinctorius Marx 270 TaxID=870435 RepID=A0A0C3PGI5_PISTI|nr:hypothetical protein M404DRAFT_710499 [Pisolithus tinctorius Marx 270]
MHHDYHLPPPPPPSGPHSVNSSPRRNHYSLPNNYVEPQQPPFRRSASYTVQWSTKQSDDISRPALPSPRRWSGPHRSQRALTLPSSRCDATSDRSVLLAQQPPSLTRRFSSSSGSSFSSVSNSPTVASQPLLSAGIGRKVAESLQLFKESAPISDFRDNPNTATVTNHRRHSASHHVENVAEAKYEFVKRADWPDPETAAIRRERSSTALERVKTLDISKEPDLPSDLDTLPRIQSFTHAVDVETGHREPFSVTSSAPLSVHLIMPHRHLAFALVPEGIPHRRLLHVVQQIIFLPWPSIIFLLIVASFSHSTTPPKLISDTPKNTNRHNHACSLIPIRRVVRG